MYKKIMSYPYPLELSRIISLVKEKEPHRLEIIVALENCTEGTWNGKAYYKFVNSENANQEGSIWQHDECLEIETDDEGTFILDILKNGMIGGIEFIRYIL